MKKDILLPAFWVDTPEKLKILMDDLQAAAAIGVDTESNSLHAYQEQVCLIQFSTPQADYLVDPLAIDDLTPLGEVFAAPHIQKIFHAAEYDLICLYRDFGFAFENLFDTMWAARVLGYRQIGLGALLARFFDVSPDKRYQRANWGKRPLPAEQLLYAQMDTHYLIPLKEILQRELQASAFNELAREDFVRFCRLNDTVRSSESTPCWQNIRNARELSPRKIAVLQKLCEFRDQIARKQNLPLFKVIGDKVLLRIAENMPTDPAGLQAAGMSEYQIRRYGQGLLRAIQRGRQAPKLYYSKASSPDPAYLERLDALQYWRKMTARHLGVESDVVLPRTILEEIAMQNPTTSEMLCEIMCEIPWRYQRFGQEILQLIQR
ncbi:MAG: ribonuclease D [Anaerolineales bacterium]